MVGFCQEKASSTRRSLSGKLEVGQVKCLLLGKVRFRSSSIWRAAECLHPLGLALGSPIFPSGCEGKLGVALESLQGRRDLT